MEIYTDGASRGNPGKSAIAYIVTRNGETLEEVSVYIDVATNNEAEYKAILFAILHSKIYREPLTIISDSQVVIRQLIGLYQVKSENLIPLHDMVRKAEQTHGYEIEYEWRKRSDPMLTKCDLLCNRVLDGALTAK